MSLCEVTIQLVQKLMKLVFSDPTLIEDAVGFKSKLSVLIFTLSRPICRLLLRLGLMREWGFIFHFFPFDVIVKNEIGIFYCRKGTQDIFIISPDFEHQLRDHFNLEKGVFVDVGAHIGRYTVMVGRKLQHGKVISIEPEPDNFEILKKNIALNKLTNVIALNVAAMDKAGEVTLYKVLGPMTGLHSVTAIRQPSKRIKVRAERLIDILTGLGIKEIDLLKIDVEGAEPLVLKGLGPKLTSVKKIIYEVLGEDECENILRSFGFKIIHVFDYSPDLKYKIAIRVTE